MVHAIRGRTDPRRTPFLCSKDCEGDRAMSDIVLEHLIDVLEESVKRNGNIPLTNRHLLNILRMVERRSVDISDGGIEP